jgi:hypothetical protein
MSFDDGLVIGRAPKTEGATPVDLPWADHSCIQRECTIQTCGDMKKYLVEKGRIVEVGPGQFQSNIAYGFDKFDPEVMFAVAEILEAGAKTYGVDAWHGRESRHHLNHAIAHLYSVLKDDPNDDENHFGNAVCRSMFAYGVFIRTGKLDVPARRSNQQLEAEKPL